MRAATAFSHAGHRAFSFAGLNRDFILEASVARYQVLRLGELIAHVIGRESP
jgi:hypothetical protein